MVSVTFSNPDEGAPGPSHLGTGETANTPRPTASCPARWHLDESQVQEANSGSFVAKAECALRIHCWSLAHQCTVRAIEAVCVIDPETAVTVIV